MIMSLKQKKRKFKPRIKLNHNINKSWYRQQTHCLTSLSLRASSPFGDIVKSRRARGDARGDATSACSRVLARLALLAQTGELLAG